MASITQGLIQQVQIDTGNKQNVASTAYGVCSTPANESNKTVDMTGFELITGTTVHIKFENHNWSNDPTLNINNTGAKPIVLYGSTAANINNDTTGWYPGAVISFTYDGTSWVRDQGYNTNNVTHTHGNINNDGTLQTTDVDIASNDQLVITDASDSNKIARSSIKFDGITNTKALTPKGTWETFNNYVHPTTSGNKHIPTGGTTGQILGWDSDGTAKWINYIGSDTHRPIQVDGTQILGNNTTPLNLVGGTNISLTNNNGEVTINNTYTYVLPKAKYNILGGLQPAYTSSNAATLSTSAAENADAPTILAKTSVANRYYAIEADVNGIPYVNVPWTDHYAWDDITGKPGTFAPSAHDHNRLEGIGRLNTNSTIPYNPSTEEGYRLVWNIYDGTARTLDATNTPSFDAGVINIPGDTGAYNGQIAISNTVKGNTRMQIRSASQIDNGAGENPRYSPDYGAWREVVTAAKATQMGSATKPIYISNTGQVVEGTELGDSAYKPILNNTDVSALGWNSAGNTDASNLRLINVNTLAYWNGAYSGVNSNISIVGTIVQGTWHGSTIDNDYITNHKITIAGNEINLGGSLAANTLVSSLGLSKAMRFIGVATVAITDGSTTDPVISGYTTKTAGDVIIDQNSSREYVWSTTGKWELLGGDESYKVTQTAITAPTAITNKWVSSIGQNANGEISVTYSALDTSGNWTGNAATATKFATAVTLWGHQFDGSANVTGNLIDAGPSIVLPVNETTFQFFTSASSAANGQFGKLSVSSAYNQVDLTNYVLDVIGTSRIKQSVSAALGINSSLKIGTARKDLNFDIANGNGSGINDGYAGGITWGNADAAYAGIYYQTSSSYGSKLLFGTTNSYTDGSYARMIITHEGKVGIGKLAPAALLDVNGTTYFNGNSTINGDIIFPSANKLDWNDGTVRQRLLITDDSTANTAVFTFQQSTNSGSSYTNLFTIKDDGSIHAEAVYGAVWNDYAEYRSSLINVPGACVIENDDGTLSIANNRLIPGASIISDTYGFSQGKTEQADTPIAVAGRVLAYPYLSREKYHAGMAVCSAPGGTVDIMTREEIRDYPDAIIGIVSEIPTYDTWGPNNIKVDNRIWIKVRY